MSFKKCSGFVCFNKCNKTLSKWQKAKVESFKKVNHPLAWLNQRLERQWTWQVIYPHDVVCTVNHQVLSTGEHSEAPKSKIIASSKYDTCSKTNKISQIPNHQH